VDTWLRTFRKAKEFCGGSGSEPRRPSKREIDYLNQLVRGIYAKRDLPAGHVLHHSKMDEDLYLAIPLQKGQLSCRELVNGQVLRTGLKQHEPLMIDTVQGEYAESVGIRSLIYARGL
jgi:N-acetylneuraminate synthase